MIITNREKKDLAIELIKQGCTQSQIAKQAHLSFKTISEIRKEDEGDAGIDYKNKKQQQYLHHIKPLSCLNKTSPLFK